MRVAIVAPLVSAIREPQRGGSQAFVSDLARGLVGRGHEVHLYAASGSQLPGVRVVDTAVDPHALAATLYRASGSAAEGLVAAEAAFAAVYAAVARLGTTSSTITPSTRPRSPRDRAARAGRAYASPPSGRGGG